MSSLGPKPTSAPAGGQGLRAALAVAACALALSTPYAAGAQEALVQAPALEAEADMPAPVAAPKPAPRPRVVPNVKLSPTQASQLRAVLGKAHRQGLRSAAADASLETVSSGGDDHALVSAVLDYARAVRTGRVAPENFLRDWGLRPASFDPAPGFVQAVQDDKLTDWLATLPPPYAGYEGLQKGLAAYRAIASRGGWPALGEGEPLTLGAKGARVAKLRQRLAIETLGEDGVPADAGDAYDANLQAQVSKAQRRYGLRPTGSVDAATLAQLNVSAADRVTQIEANLERWRWLPAQLPADRIQVNIAAAVLTVFKGDQPLTSMRAVTGRPGDETPMLTSEIKSIVINPPWNVPSGIAQKELWPKEHAHPGYLARNGYRVISLPDGGSRLQQKSERSALGKFKFDFQNPYGVYLHDTPGHGAFAKYSRMVSHGCVRLERPADLAKLVMNGDPVWTDAAIDQAVADGKTVRAPLPKPLQVYLLYWTAFAAPDGQVNFRADPYGWDATLGAKIRDAAKPGGPAPTVVAAQTASKVAAQ